jgi:hypothetical protein
MSIYSVVDFWRTVQTKPELQAKLTEIMKHATDGLCVGGAQVAREAGFDVAPQEMQDVGTVAAFWNRVDHDDTLCQKLAAARESDTPEVAMREITKVAAEAGYAFSTEALQYVTGALVNSGRAIQGQSKEGIPLSDDELAAVAGGTSFRASLEMARRKLWQEVPKIGPGVVGAKP